METHEQNETRAVYWGTNIDERQVERNFDKFIHEFRVDGLEYYMYQLHQFCEIDQFVLNIDGNHLSKFNNFLYRQLIYYPPEVIPIFDQVVQRIFYEEVLALRARSE